MKSEEGRPLAITQMGLAVNFDARIVTGFTGIIARIDEVFAIADGLTPALKAARTAFSLPVVNECAPSSAASWRRCGFASATGFSFAGLGSRRPRRSASVVTAANSVSISRSSNRISAPAKSFGKKWRCCEARLSGPALPFETAEGPAAVTVGEAENRSGVVSASRRVGMPPTMPPVGSPRQRPAGAMQLTKAARKLKKNYKSIDLRGLAKTY